MSLPPSHSLVLLVAWWCKNPVRTLSATAADLQTGGAVRHWPLGGGIPAGDVKRIPAGGGDPFSHRGKEDPQQRSWPARALGRRHGGTRGPAGTLEKWTRRDGTL